MQVKYKAVLFDLFETLITEWGHKKYTKREMCADLGIDRELFDRYWEEKEQERYTGDIRFEETLDYISEQTGIRFDEAVRATVIEKRITTKSACVEFVNPDVYLLLKTIKDLGLPTAIVSNCSSEEVKVLKESEIYGEFNEVVLSYEVHMKKPDAGIYLEAARRLGVKPEECLFVGDGGSNELTGARNAGMDAIQAKWYTNMLPDGRGNLPGFPVAEEPADVIRYMRRIETERLVLRPVAPYDVQDIHAYAGDPGINMMMFLPHESIEVTEKFVEYALSEWDLEEPDDLEYVILLDGRIIGGINLERCEEEGSYELGWVMHRDYRGRGYATEAAKALLPIAFDERKAERVRAHCDSRNAASERVMQKLGMLLADASGTRVYEKTGVTSGEFMYVITREEWKRKHE